MKQRWEFGAQILARSAFALFLVSCLLFLHHDSFAQPMPGGLAEKQEQLQALINTRLVNGLGLTPDKAQRVTQILQKYHQKRRELRQSLHALNLQLQSAASSNDPTQANQVVLQLQKTKGEMDKLDGEQFDEIKTILTPQQQAKFLLIMQQVRQEIMQFRRGGGAPPNGPFPASAPNPSGLLQ
jgi:Spy/CpxP family protein refolding chaperone